MSTMASISSYKTYNKELSGDDIGVWMNFNTEADEQVEVQMGVSFVSMAKRP